MPLSFIRALAALVMPFAFAVPALAASTPVAPATCIDLQGNLALGAHDSAVSTSVSQLQAYLKTVSFLASTTPQGAYGASTAAAVKKFQAQAGVPQTGTVGPRTRAALVDRSCPTHFAFMGIIAPRALAAKQTGSWIIGVTLPAGAASPLLSSAEWGDGTSVTGAQVAVHARTAYLTFTHTYAAAGTYAPVFTITFGNEPAITVRAHVPVQ